MKLQQLDDALAYVLPARFTMDEAFDAIEGAAPSSMRQRKLLGAALTERGYVKTQARHESGRSRFWHLP